MKLAALLLLAGCGPHVIAPVAPGDRVCSNDTECGDGYVCAFPGVDTRAVCQWYGPPNDFEKRRRAIDAGH